MYLDTLKYALLFLLCLLSILQEKCSKGFPLKSAFHKKGEQKRHSYGYPAVCCDLLYAGSNSYTGYLMWLILNQLQFFD